MWVPLWCVCVCFIYIVYGLCVGVLFHYYVILNFQEISLRCSSRGVINPYVVQCDAPDSLAATHTPGSCPLSTPYTHTHTHTHTHTPCSVAVGAQLTTEKAQVRVQGATRQIWEPLLYSRCSPSSKWVRNVIRGAAASLCRCVVYDVVLVGAEF